MHQNVPHTFYDIPFHILMPVTEFLAKHIDGLANNLKLLDKAKENYGVTFDYLQIETILLSRMMLTEESMCRSRPLSLILSLIDQYFIFVRTFFGK